MKTIVLNSFDGLDAVALTELSEPSLGEAEVLVQVRAAAIGPWDVATTMGLFASMGA